MAIRWGRVAVAFAGFQVVDGIACAIPLGYIKRDLDHIGCPPELQRALPVIKGASALGLVVGRAWPRLGRLTTIGLVGYFAAAVGFHIRARDPAWKAAPAASLGALSAVLALTGYRKR